MEQLASPRRLAVIVALLLTTFVASPALVRAADAPAADGTVTQDDIIAGQMTIDFKTRTNLDSSGKLKDGSAALGTQDKYTFNLSVAKTTEFNGDIVRQPKLYSRTLGRTQQNAKLAYSVNIAVLNPKDLKQKRNVGKWVGEVAVDPNTGAYNLGQGESPVAEICMMKNQATQTMAFCASEAVQIFGGAGFMRGVKVERIYREVKVNAIGGGTEEIMKDLASRQMGL